MKAFLATTCLLTGALLAGGCATKKYVRNTAAPIQAKVDQVGDQTSRNGQAITNGLKGYQGTATWKAQQGTATFKGQQGTATFKGQQGTVQHGSFSQAGGFTFQQHQPQQQQQMVTNGNKLPPPNNQKQTGGN